MVCEVRARRAFKRHASAVAFFFSLVFLYSLQNVESYRDLKLVALLLACFVYISNEYINAYVTVCSVVRIGRLLSV